MEGGKLILDETPSMAHGNGKYEVLFIAKSLSDRVIAMENDELGREMSRLRMRRGLPAENLVVRLAEMSGDVACVERDICAVFGWDFSGNGRMESLDDSWRPSSSIRRNPMGAAAGIKLDFRREEMDIDIKARKSNPIRGAMSNSRGSARRRYCFAAVTSRLWS